MNRIDYFLLPWYKKLWHKITSGVRSFFYGTGRFFCALPEAVYKGFRAFFGELWWLCLTFARGGFLTKLSYVVMGAGNTFRGQIVKGFIFHAVEAGFVAFMMNFGRQYIAKLPTLGTVKRGWYFDEELGIDVLVENGDNSMLILLYGILSLAAAAVFIAIWAINIRSAKKAEDIAQKGGRLPKFKDEIKELLDGGFHKTLLFLPTVGIVVFTVIPLIYMIALAFTNYDRNHQVPANLFTWVGLDNFRTILGTGSVLGETFRHVLGWTLVWAVFATFLNYFLGIALALLINRRGLRFKGLFRTLFVLAIAVPQFVSLLIMKNILAEAGPLNVLLMEWGLISQPLPFFTDPTWARVTVIIVNLWIGIPYTMLITSGILMNIPHDLYEAAKMDGAPRGVIFRKITMPYVLYVTAPYLITQFIGNINNFNIIYFLTEGAPATLDYYQAGKTDLLVTWLYKLTVDSRDYSLASVIGILVFVICSAISLLTFRRTKSYNGEAL